MPLLGSREMTDLTSKFLEGCSPYISALNYDVNNRRFLLECVDNPVERRPLKRALFSNVLSYVEEIRSDPYDDDCMDSVIGMHWIDKNRFCLTTEKREVILGLEDDPIIETVI